MGYAKSRFRDFEIYLRHVVGLDEKCIQLILKQYKSNFALYKLSPGINSIKNFPQAAYTMSNHERTSPIDNDVISMKKKLILTRVGGTFGTLGFKEMSFLKIYWVLQLIGIIYPPMQFMLVAQTYILEIHF